MREKIFVGFVQSSVHLQGGLKPREKNFMLKMFSSPFLFVFFI